MKGKSTTAQIKVDDKWIDPLKEQHGLTPQEIDFERSWKPLKKRVKNQSLIRSFYKLVKQPIR